MIPSNTRDVVLRSDQMIDLHGSKVVTMRQSLHLLQRYIVISNYQNARLLSG